MAVLNSGSIANNILNGISPLPNGISGLLVSIVDTQRYFVEQYTGDSIGDSIAEKYQPCITDLSTANICKLMAIQDNGVSEVRLFDELVRNDNLNLIADKFQVDGMSKVKLLMKGIKFFKARG